MSSRFKSTDRSQQYMFPPTIDDWLPENHLARFVVDIVGQLDIKTLTEVYRGGGSKAYHPEILLSLLFYGYATGVYSSRKILLLFDIFPQTHIQTMILSPTLGSVFSKN